MQAKHSSGLHPLLREEFIMSDEREARFSPIDDAEGAAGHASDVIDALGTLSISDHGISRFFGPTGGSEVRFNYPHSYS